MIRTKDKILGELNTPNTVTKSNSAGAHRLMVGQNNRQVQAKLFNTNVVTLLIANKGVLEPMVLNQAFNKAIGTDSNGKIILIDRSTL